MSTLSRFRGEGGSVTAFTVVVLVGLLMAAGLVLDGGRILAARRDAIDVGRGAARAGAQAVVPPDTSSGGVPQVDPAEAGVLARRYLARAGYQGDVAVAGTTVTVTVHTRVSMLVFPIGSRDVRVEADARAVDRPGQQP